MKTILLLVGKDLRRDWKHPWSILLFTALPLLMTGLMAMIFAGGGGSGKMPTIHLAVLDQDKDMFSSLLKSMPAQGDAATQLRLHFVDNREAGVRLLEKRQASAFIVLPANMTVNLLEGRTNTIELYENPAEQVLPKVVRQGVSLLAAGVSGAAEVLGEPLRDARTLFRGKEFPSELAVLGVATGSFQKLKNMKTYLFPPLIQFKTVTAADYAVAEVKTDHTAGKEGTANHE